MFAAWVLRLSPDSSWRRPHLPASAAPASTKLASGWSYSQTSIPAGVADGAELAIDQKRRKIFVTDADDFLQGSQERTGPALSASAQPWSRS